MATSGNSSQVALDGIDSVGAIVGINGKIKGKKGNWITLAEWKYDDVKNDYVPEYVLSGYIDGTNLKEDTWYTLKNHVFVEQEENE